MWAGVFFFIIHYGCGKGNTSHKVLKHGHALSVLYTYKPQTEKAQESRQPPLQRPLYSTARAHELDHK